MRTQKTQVTPSHHCLHSFCLHSQRKKEGVIQGKLRIRSIPGAFLVLGMVVVIIGTAVAVAGYWPYRAQQSALAAVSDGLLSTSQTSGWGLGAKGLFSTASLIHSERMKLLGPVIMGVGLFILICANTVLYENRDRETQMLLAQAQSVICSVSAAVPSADFTQVHSLARNYQWVSSLPAAHLNILCLQKLASSEPVLQVKTSEEKEILQQKSVLQVLHHQESSSSPSIQSSNSCNSSKVDFNTVSDAERRASGDQKPQPEIYCKLSKCLTVSSLSTLEEEEWKLSTLPPRRSHSVSHKTKPHTLPRVQFWVQERDEPSSYHPRQLQRQSTSEVCINTTGAGTMILDINIASEKEQQHCSWPRLDLGYARRYLKLENKEDSVDKLLDLLELQCSQLDWTFGSGPFQ